MSPDTSLKVSPTRTVPLVWVERVVLLRSIKPIQEIRDVALHRGLNIIWGVDEDSNGDSLGIIGHGVGKTSFCRLVRYCLGEATFGTKDSRERIKKAYPFGYVAAIVYLDGYQWSVARPIGNSNLSYAAPDSSINDMIENRSGRGDSYHVFKSEIEKTTMSKLPTKKISGSEQPLEWEHILSWCSRDQEARYQKVWDWRSPRSESGSPIPIRPKEDRLFMIRVVLGLITGNEVKHVQTLANIEKQIDDTNKRLEERRKEPEYWLRHNEKKLKRLLNIPDTDIVSLDSNALFDLPNRIGIEKKELKEEANRIEQELVDIRSEVSDLTLRISSASKNILFLKKHQQTYENRKTEFETGEKEKNVAERIEEIEEETCELGGISLKDCQYIIDRLKVLSFTDATDSKKAQESIKEIEKELVQLKKQIRRIEDTADSDTKKRKHLHEKTGNLHGQLRRIENRIETMDKAYEDYKEWKAVFDGNVDDTELNRLTIDIDQLHHKQTKQQDGLKKLFKQHNQRIEKLKEVFDGAVKDTISSSHRGLLTFELDEIVFRICHNKSLAGEAIETLSILLADVCAVILGMQEIGYHPCFLIHDSPREADLGGGLYRNYLNFAARLHEMCGGKDDAPFQYIVTTTTAPPKQLDTDEFVSLKLDSSEEKNMLFCIDLGREDAEFQSFPELPLSLE